MRLPPAISSTIKSRILESTPNADILSVQAGFACNPTQQESSLLRSTKNV
jgi:hypothetical protein